LEEAEKSWGLFAARMQRHSYKASFKRDCRCLFKNSDSRQAGVAPCFLGNFFISRKARKAGLLAKRVSDAISQSRASSLVKGFENAAPAWLDQALPCASALFVYIRVI
jgi:hypothetical protein